MGIEFKFFKLSNTSRVVYYQVKRLVPLADKKYYRYEIRIQI